MYMGDRPLVMGKSALTPFSIAVDIVCRGWSNIALRDEIFIQLCRQTTRNPLLSVISVYLLVLSLTATYALVVYLSVNLEVTEVAMVVVEVAAAVVTFFVFHLFILCIYLIVCLLCYKNHEYSISYCIFLSRLLFQIRLGHQKPEFWNVIICHPELNCTVFYVFLQCFDAVGWVTGMTSDL